MTMIEVHWIDEGGVEHVKECESDEEAEAWLIMIGTAGLESWGRESE
jgi:hypothetical protein